MSEIEYNEGDLVEAVKGKQALRSQVEVTGRMPGIPVGLAFFYLSTLRDEGFTVTVIERAKPALPTEVGAYVDKYGHDVWTITMHHGLMCVANSSSHPEKYAPFTRLEPVPETAKKVLDMVRDRALVSTTDRMTIRYLVLENIAAEFGVTGETNQ